MMSIETRVNDVLVGFAYIVNKSPIYNKNGSQIYSIEYHRVGKEPQVLNFRVTHNSEEGLEKLFLIVYKKLDEILKNKRD